VVAAILGPLAMKVTVGLPMVVTTRTRNAAPVVVREAQPLPRSRVSLPGAQEERAGSQSN
jgi:hypothetical protein